MSGDDLILPSVDSDHVQRMRFGDADAAALSDGVMMNARMRANDGAASADDLAGSGQTIGLVFRFQVAIDEAGIVTIGNKTNFLRLGLLSHREFVAPRRLAHIRLGHFAEREQRTRKLVLSQLPKKVRLVLLRIVAAQQSITIRRGVEFDARVVSRCYFFATQTRRQTIERRKLQTTVASKAGNRRLAVQIAGDKRLHDIALKFALEI